MAVNENAADTVHELRRFSTRWLRERFPLADELRSYNREKFRADLLAGATVSLVSIPQAIGFSLIAGLPPLMVIMSVIVGGFVYALFTSSHHVVFGPSNSMSIILAATIFSFKGGALAPTESVSRYFYESTPIEKEKKIIQVFRDIRDYVSDKMESTTLARTSASFPSFAPPRIGNDRTAPENIPAARPSNRLPEVGRRQPPLGSVLPRYGSR